MKVIQIPFCFYPDPVGGTEIYVEALARHLKRRGVSVVIAAPGERNCAYVHQGIFVRRYELNKSITNLEELYGEGDTVAAYNFGRLLDEEYPNIVHMHALTRGVSFSIVKETKSRGIPVVFTYHTPTVSCQRGTLLRWGSEICDGLLNLDTCTTCTLTNLGLSRPVAHLVGRSPEWIGKLLRDLRLSGGIWTALRMRALMHIRQNIFLELTNKVDHIVALCRWGQQLLVKNGVNKEKITICRHGIYNNSIHNNDDESSEFTGTSSEANYFQSKMPTLRIIFLGRLNPIKGLHVFIDALCKSPDLRVKFDVYGIIQSNYDFEYLKHLEDLINADTRINILPSVPQDQIIPLLRRYDILVAPSQWLETGPMVVLEAFAAGIPVIGSNLGGIAELVEHEVNGLLVKHNSIKEWCIALNRLSSEKDLLTNLKTGIIPPRDMKEVAEEMIAVYRSLRH